MEQFIPKLSQNDLNRIADVLIRVNEILSNHGIGCSFSTLFGHGFDKSVATDFGDGQLRLALALDINTGVPIGLVTPMGRISLDEKLSIDPEDAKQLPHVLRAEFGGSFTKNSARSAIPIQGSDAQVMVLSRDADGSALAPIEGVTVKDDFNKCNKSLLMAPVKGLLKDTSPARLRVDNTLPEALNVIDRKMVGIPDYAEDIHYAPEMALLMTFAQGIYRSKVSGFNLDLIRQTFKSKLAA